MDEPGRDDKAGGVGGRVGGIWKLNTVSIAVENGKDRDEKQRDHFRGTPCESDREPERQYRQRNAKFDVGQWEARHSRNAAERHDERERDGKRPDSAATHLRAPNADGEHGKQVIEAEERVLEPGGEASERSLYDMCGSRLNGGYHDGQSYQDPPASFAE